MAGFTEKKQALHDMIASCLVLKKVYPSELDAPAVAFVVDEHVVQFAADLLGEFGAAHESCRPVRRCLECDIRARAHDRSPVSIHCASISNPNDSRSIMVADKMAPSGQAKSFPARVGAEPWIGLVQRGLIEAPAAHRRNQADRTRRARRLRRSGCHRTRFEVRITSNCAGRSMICMAALSTYI